MLRRHATGLRALLMLADGLLAAGLLVVLSYLRFGADWAVYWRQVVPDPLAFLGLFSLGWVASLAYFGLYRPRARWSIRSEALDLLRATLAVVLATLAVLFWFKLPDVSRLFLLVLFPSLYVVTLATRALLRLAFRRLRAEGRNSRYVLVVGAGPRARAFGRKLEAHRELGLQVVGVLDDDPAYATDGPWPHLGRLDDLERVLHDRIVDEVAICLPFSQWGLVDAIAHVAEEEGKIVRVPMDVLDRAFTAGRVEDLDGTPVYSLVSGPDRAVGLALKRAVDLVVAGLGLVVLSPILGAVALTIRLTEGPPVLFRQTRVGLHGRPFSVLKFRTMVVDAEARRAELEARNLVRGPAFKVEDDPRVTPLGRWLRRLSIDELPQLWNVLRGDMSLVGPRPPVPDEVARYDIWHRRRLSMKPGVTGLWQVSARRNTDFDERAELDLVYIDRWSLWLDVKILARTIPAALEGR
jgi:exopolysaccharide biosynthesis polyprenyl glycosylphosphotransferase